ncbi:hypothetical protein AB3N60_17070 [Leptospira sp. WS39.C2]
MEPVQELNRIPEFPIHNIVGNSANPYQEIYECLQCHNYWWIHLKGTGDPRSTYPEYYEQTAELLDDQRSELIRNPTVSSFLKNTNSLFPYTFFPEILEAISSKESETLKKLYLERVPHLPSSAKVWLRTWFQKKYPKEYEEVKSNGFPGNVRQVITLSPDESVLVTEWIGIDLFVMLSHNEGAYFLTCLKHPENKIIWKQEVKGPFLEGMSIPYLFYHSGYLCYYQGFQKGSEYFSKLNRPNELLIFSLEGNLLISILLSLRCYEILSTDERDVSENRVVHNFNFFILSGKLFIPHSNEVHIYDLNSKQIIQKIKTPDGDPFSGKVFETESGSYVFHTLKGVFITDLKWNIIFHHQSKYHPVFIDSHSNFYYYYSIIDQIQTGEQIRFFQKKESGIQLLYELASPPVTIPGGIYIPFVWDKSYLLDNNLNQIKELNFTSSDTLSSHSFGTTKVPILVTEKNLVITNDYQSIVIIDFNGEELNNLSIQSEVLNLFSFDGTHSIVLLSCFDEYSEGDQVELLFFNQNDDLNFRKILPGSVGLSVSFEGILIFSEKNILYSLDLFLETAKLI